MWGLRTFAVGRVLCRDGHCYLSLVQIEVGSMRESLQVVSVTAGKNWQTVKELQRGDMRAGDHACPFPWIFFFLFNENN